MSDLATVSAEVAPFLALAANSLGSTVLSTAQQRIADRTVTAGEGFFRRLLRRDSDGGDQDRGSIGGGTEPLLDTRTADTLDGLLARLDDRDRQLLSDAITAWLAEPADRREASHLLEHVAQRSAPAPVQIINNHPTANGAHSLAAVEIHGDIHLGGGGRTQDGS
ncbi:hypothetical protein ACIBK8_28905 [Streptomyces sp. NPDC050161]|uniref:hypothetical protein n=1 Tax=Streptomyces sp. NPDC050161 TaxID=3365604 RepID=UPI00379A5EB2